MIVDLFVLLQEEQCRWYWMKLPIIRHCSWNYLREHQGNVKFAVKLWITWRITTSIIILVDTSAQSVCGHSLGQITSSNTWSGNMLTFHFGILWEILHKPLTTYHMGWSKIIIKSSNLICMNRISCTSGRMYAYYRTGSGDNQIELYLVI